ncbi:MAG TPA: MASE3 domain-containing protein [Bryobacteraceae bacterium]|nr:MASE3 domain-containing protein [Bryobacteraceae bacterium]
MTEQRNEASRAGTLLITVLMLGLGLTRVHGHLLFHSLVEAFTIAVAWSVFFLAWNARRFLDNHYLLVIGIASLFSGGIDVLHLLAYKGMNVFPGAGADLPTQLWIAGRYLDAAGFMIAPIFIRRRLRSDLAVAGFGAAAGLMVISTLGGWFPRCYVEGSGLTTFKVASEYLVSLALLASMAWLLRNGRQFEPRVLRQLAAAILFGVAASMAFTLYEDVYGALNVLGHLFRFLSFCLIYQAIVVTGLVRPYDLLFRDLARSEAALRRSDERYRAFVGNSSEGICRVEVEPSVPVDLPEEEQIRQLITRGRIRECNDAFARMHGAGNAEEITGARLADVLARSSRDATEVLRAFVRSGYRTVEGESRAGDGRYLAGSLTGVVQNGCLVRAWGLERDITERKRAAAERERLIAELQQALAEVRTLTGLLPICASCKKIRDDHGYWTQVESYFQARSGVSFSHGICPDCVKVLYPELE